ncbi:hypothetical protein [Dictyobacter arantiisoli]|uniref:Uncharacterized protein n=1 Tax=Dictyobacter arantiisoli TaxID=2014874 RepID=A0A5A5TJ97_9CHLR|nr:hypothetical protein [Dictyobacter arantiisoli]GCF11305.1 hypothetical protein KDI_48690 [Dictyobacter arantiisoli]
MLHTSHKSLRYDIHALGWIVLAAPIMLLSGFLLFAVLLLIMGIDPTRFFVAGLEMFLPIAMGIIVSTTCTRDAALEIQLTFPRTFAATAMRRALLTLGWSALLALGATLILILLRPDIQPQQMQSLPLLLALVGDQLLWLAPLLWFTALGMFITLLTHSRTAGGALLSTIWLLEMLFIKNLLPHNPWLRPLFLFPTTLEPTISDWLSTRSEILGMALLLFILSWLLLRNREHILKGIHHE